MSRFLKFIVHLVVICTIICVLGMAIPPFFGVNTVIMDDEEKATNLPLGSVTYAIPQRTEELTVGTPILVQEDGKTYRYNIMTVNLENGTGTVVDPSVSGGETITVAVKDYVPKVVITIGFVGYLLIATQSVTGLIILGLVLVFLIILYVIAELWKREPEEELGDTPAGYVKSEKELRQEEKARARMLKEEEREIKRQGKHSRRDKAEKKRTIRTGGFVDEIEEEDEELSPQPAGKPVEMQNAAASEAHEVLKKEIAAATAENEEEPEVSPVQQETRQIVEEVKPQPVEKKRPEPEVLPDEPKEATPVEKRRLAVPVRTAAQLSERARAAGDEPEIFQDDITKVTFLDYSDIIGGGDSSQEE